MAPVRPFLSKISPTLPKIGFVESIGKVEITTSIFGFESWILAKSP
jgi:hypothetical protein